MLKLLRMLGYLLCISAFGGESDVARLTTALKGPWTTVDIALYLDSSCTGQSIFGQRLSRESGKIIMRSLTTERGEEVLGEARPIAPECLFQIIDDTIRFFQDAIRTQSERERITEQTAAIIDEAERLKRIVQLSQKTSPDAGGILVSFGKGVTATRFSDDFDSHIGSVFCNWIKNPQSTKPNGASK